MFCRNCGTNFQGNQSFCTNCGAPAGNTGMQNNNVFNNAAPTFTLISAHNNLFKKYAQFKGRSRRSEFWKAMLAIFIVMLVFSIPYIFALTAALINGYSSGLADMMTGFGIIALSIYSLVILVPTWALTVRRLHDIGKSGWFALLSLIPYVGSIIIIIFAAMDSQPGPNQYGPNPKENIII